MIWLAMVFFGVALLALTFVASTRKQVAKTAGREYEEAMSALFIERCVLIVATVLTIVFLFWSMVVFVSAGTVGVQDMLGNVRNRTLSAGPALKNPFARIIEMSVRTDTYIMDHRKKEGPVEGDDSIPVLTKDNLTLKTDWTIAYHLVEPAAPWVYKTFGPDYVSTIIRPKAREVIKLCASAIEWEKLASDDREKYAMAVMKAMQEGIDALSAQRGFEGQAVIVDQAMLRDVVPPDDINAAIQAKLKEQQALQKMEFTLAIAKKEAERKLIEATGIRDFQRTVVEGVTPSLLTWRWVEVMEKLAVSPNKTFIIAPRDAPPIMMPAQ